MEPVELGRTTEASASSSPYNRRFTTAGQSPFDTVDWVIRDAQVGSFEQLGVEFPSFWSQNAINTVSKLYFATINGVREHSLKQLVGRVVNKISEEGLAAGYFESQEQQDTFHDELVFILLHQMAAFNTPVWLNLGVPGRKQTCSACFLIDVEDTMTGPGGITDWWATESRIFKAGSGSGANLSKIRGSMEPLSTGGVASGPTSYMRVADANAGTLKSGGAHRRAAKMVCLDVDHPDIIDFIETKEREDERMRLLMEAGVNLNPATPDGEKNIAEVTSFQNANNSVRVNNVFMRKATGRGNNDEWRLRARVDGEVTSTVSAAGLLRKIAQAAWKCADPGIMFDDEINAWHTTPHYGRINTSNPCCEVHQNDNTSCNLASINLKKFLMPIVGFDLNNFEHVVDVMVTAMDITCGFSDLPTELLTQNTRDYRQLGLGYANLGGYLMSRGIAYDSDEGRRIAAEVTALMTSRAALRSAQLASSMGAFTHYKVNAESMHNVVAMHMQKTMELGSSENVDRALLNWSCARALSSTTGFRNSQFTVLAPTGTISIMMDCDTSGVEPSFSLVVHKDLAGGGSMVITNGSVVSGLKALGYDDVDMHVARIADDNDARGHVKLEHENVFATAVGGNSISPAGHVYMMGAIQPFLSGAISKTVNMPEDCTVEDIERIYVLAWEVGCKSLAVYRDNSKATQVIRSKKKDPEPQTEPPFVETAIRLIASQQIVEEPKRRRMPDERESLTHKFSVGGHNGYVTAGKYEDGTLGEMFVTTGKDGSTIQGLLGVWSIAVSIGLQHGVPLETFVRRYSGTNFAPAGITSNSEIPQATSLPDYIMRWLASRFMDVDAHQRYKVLSKEWKARETARLDVLHGAVPMLPISDEKLSAIVAETKEQLELGDPCSECQSGFMQRTGACETCQACGFNTGCG